MLKNDLKIFWYFLSQSYWVRVRETFDQNPKITRELLINWLEHSRQYLPKHGLEPYHSTEELKELFDSLIPCLLKESPLPENLLGIFIPNTKDNKPAIVLNSQSIHRAMHISTLGHEIGHLMVNLYSGVKHSLKTSEQREIKARSEDLLESIGDEEELLADLGATMGIYPEKYFDEVFCDANKKVLYRYKKFPFLLFIKSALFIRSQIPELKKNFLSCPNKIFHLTVTLHYARLRVFLREAYDI